MIPYTKALVKITPLAVSESADFVGRSVVTLQVEYADGKVGEVVMLLPERGQRGDSMTVSHHLNLDISGDEKTAELYDSVLRSVGFRSEAERLN